MIERPTIFRQRNVMIINDIPFKKELEQEEKFSSAANINFLTSLRTGRLNTWDTSNVVKGILGNDIFTTYLSYEGYAEGNYDFKNSFRLLKNLKEIEINGNKHLVKAETAFVDEKTLYYNEFHKLPQFKNLYIDSKLNDCLQSLINEINNVKPKIIILTGKWVTLLLTNVVTYVNNKANSSDAKPLGCLVKLRASVLKPTEELGFKDDILLYPMYHPVNAISMPSKAYLIKYDLLRIINIYHEVLEKGVNYYFTSPIKPILGTSKTVVLNYLDNLLIKLNNGEKVLTSIDIETFYNKIIDCIGFATSATEGICIPFCTKTNANFWSIDDEIEITLKIIEVLKHSNLIKLGQNFQYDCQYFYKWYKININPNEDTMILHHIMRGDAAKNLAFLASIYCKFYTYWKDDSEAIEDNPETRWIYNIKDLCYTYEVFTILSEAFKTYPTSTQALYRFQIDELHPLLVDRMNKGVRINVKLKEEYYNYYNDLLNQGRQKLNDVLGFEFNPQSPQQVKKLFKDFLNIDVITKKRKGAEQETETCDAASMKIYIDKYPIYKPILGLMLELASLKVFVNTFLGMELDEDNRARTQYKIPGTVTGRLASTKNVWKKGGNFQNIPEKGKVKLHYILENIDYEDEGNNILDEINTIEEMES